MQRFSVVANEIKTLSDISQESIGEIPSLTQSCVSIAEDNTKSNPE